MVKLSDMNKENKLKAYVCFLDSGIRKHKVDYCDFVSDYANAYFATSDYSIIQMLLREMPYDIQEKCYNRFLELGNSDSEGFLGFKKMFDKGYFSPNNYDIMEY